MIERKEKYASMLNALGPKTIRTKIFVPLCYDSYEITVAKLRNYRHLMTFVYSSTVFLFVSDY